MTAVDVLAGLDMAANGEDWSYSVWRQRDTKSHSASADSDASLGACDTRPSSPQRLHGRSTPAATTTTSNRIFNMDREEPFVVISCEEQTPRPAHKDRKDPLYESWGKLGMQHVPRHRPRG